MNWLRVQPPEEIIHINTGQNGPTTETLSGKMRRKIGKKKWNDAELGGFCFTIAYIVKYNPWYDKFDGELQRVYITMLCRMAANHNTLKVT